MLTDGNPAAEQDDSDRTPNQPDICNANCKRGNRTKEKWNAELPCVMCNRSFHLPCIGLRRHHDAPFQGVYVCEGCVEPLGKMVLEVRRMRATKEGADTAISIIRSYVDHLGELGQKSQLLYRRQKRLARFYESSSMVGIEVMPEEPDEEANDDPMQPEVVTLSSDDPDASPDYDSEMPQVLEWNDDELLPTPYSLSEDPDNYGGGHCEVPNVGDDEDAVPPDDVIEMPEWNDDELLSVQLVEAEADGPEHTRPEGDVDMEETFHWVIPEEHEGYVLASHVPEIAARRVACADAAVQVPELLDPCRLKQEVVVSETDLATPQGELVGYFSPPASRLSNEVRMCRCSEFASPKTQHPPPSVAEEPPRRASCRDVGLQAEMAVMVRVGDPPPRWVYRAGTHPTPPSPLDDVVLYEVPSDATAVGYNLEDRGCGFAKASSQRMSENKQIKVTSQCLRRVSGKHEMFKTDQYLYCHLCQDLCPGICQLHRSKFCFVTDTNVSQCHPNDPKRAFHSRPTFLEILRKEMWDSNHQVVTKIFIPRFTIFGPFVGVNSKNPKSFLESDLCWMIIGESGAMHCVDGREPSKSNWMRYVPFAQVCKIPHNLEVFQYSGLIFYRAVADIPAGSELIVFYGERYFMTTIAPYLRSPDLLRTFHLRHKQPFSPF